MATLTVNRTILIGDYLGETSIKTQKICDKGKGGTLFIESNTILGKNDPFSEECISILNKNKDVTIIYL